MPESYGIISADDHVNPPATIYAERVPARWRDEMPRVEQRGDREVLVFDGQERPFTQLEGSAGIPSEDVQLLAKTKQDGRKGGWDPDARIVDMDFDGVEAQVLFGSGAGGGVAIRTLARDKQQVLIPAGIDTSLDLLDHLIRRDNRFPIQMAAPLRVNLIFDVQAGYTPLLHRADGPGDAHGLAKTGITIDNGRKIGNAGDLFGAVGYFG